MTGDVLPISARRTSTALLLAGPAAHRGLTARVAVLDVVLRSAGPRGRVAERDRSYLRARPNR
ncbi:hypothetical protein ACGF1Z_22950 [Streptomyces sp. NPDC048018]|uniref:hypothetical protein n=1 Tax=Streptomyces sp. NPDC048018 TaxID=3365499 RepID=UPI003721B876